MSDKKMVISPKTGKSENLAKHKAMIPLTGSAALLLTK